MSCGDALQPRLRKTDERTAFSLVLAGAQSLCPSLPTPLPPLYRKTSAPPWKGVHSGRVEVGAFHGEGAGQGCFSARTPPLLWPFPPLLLWGRRCWETLTQPFSPGPPLRVNVSVQGRSASHTLCLSCLTPLGSPEEQPLRAHTNASSFEFQDLVPGSRYQLEVTALRP